MSTMGYDDLTQALIAQRVLEAADQDAEAGGTEPAALSREDERHLDALVRLYEHSNPMVPTTGSATRRRAIGVGLGLAAAVLLAVALRGRPGAPPLGTHYELELQRELAVVRGDEARSVRIYRRDRTLEVWLRPVHAVPLPVEVVAYARRSGETHELAIVPTVQPNGVVHIVIDVRDTGLAIGEWELVFIVGRANELPTVEALPDEVDVTVLPYDVLSAVVRVVSPEASVVPR